MYRHILVASVLLSISHVSFANWFPSPTKWLNTQCQQRIAQYPQLNLSAPAQQTMCQCMVQQVKSQLSFQEFVSLTQLSEAQLQQRYRQQTTNAFKACQKTLHPNSKSVL